MIEAKSLTKRFGSFTALNQLNCRIEKGSIYGMVGSNGAGKSTLLRIIAGVYRPDGGQLLVDGEPVFENLPVKERIFFIPDNPVFLPQANIEEMARFYRIFYDRFQEGTFQKLKSMFPLDPKMKIMYMSKGMQRQAAILLALATLPDYLLLDEAFDGLDPVMRQVLRSILADWASERETTVIMSSHNLRELEDITDHVGLIHKGGVVFEKDLDSIKLGIHRIQAVFEPIPPAEAFEGLDILRTEQRGKLFSFVIRGQSEEITAALEKLHPVFMEALPLTLEEVFIKEMEVAGYDANSILK